jgi:Holliday junction resolvase|tara:strand:+ start:6474 stop:6800 length:327 start_codon:yes stop_codon:yes gene_type:complete
MGKKQKVKGNRIERKIVAILQENNFSDAKRTWGSSGRSMGLDDEVDVVLQEGVYLQVKGRRKLASYIRPKESVIDAQILVEDRQEPLAVITFNQYMEYVKFRNDQKET